jgi:hypothetical protein
MSIIHRKLKPVDQNVGDQVLHVYRTPETVTSRSECWKPGTGNGNGNGKQEPRQFHVYRKQEFLHVCRTPGHHNLHVYRTPEAETRRLSPRHIILFPLT